jgi:hypothetical protein
MGTSATPFLTPSQRADALILFSVTPNARRIRVLTAYLGTSVGDLYDKMGLKTATLNSYRHTKDRQDYWKREGAVTVAFRLALFLGLSMTELWEIDDDFRPWECVPLLLNENSARMSRTRTRPRLALVNAQ